MIKRLFLVIAILLFTFSSAFAGGTSTILYGTGPQSVTTGGDVEVAKIVISYIDGTLNCTPVAHASANTWTANAVWYAGLITGGGQWVTYDFKSDYGNLIDRNMYGEWQAYRTDNIKHDLMVTFDDGLWIDFGACTICATVMWDFKATKQTDVNYDDNK